MAILETSLCFCLLCRQQHAFFDWLFPPQGQHFWVPQASTNGELGPGFALMQSDACFCRVRELLSDGRNLPFGPSHLSRHVFTGSCKRIRVITLTNDPRRSGIVSDLSWWPSSSWANQNSSVLQRRPSGSSICLQFGSPASRLTAVVEGWPRISLLGTGKECGHHNWLWIE